MISFVRSLYAWPTMCTSVLEQQFNVLAVWLGVPTSVLCNRTLRIDNFIAAVCLVLLGDL